MEAGGEGGGLEYDEPKQPPSTAFLFASEGEKSFAVDASILFSENLSFLV